MPIESIVTFQHKSPSVELPSVSCFETKTEIATCIYCYLKMRTSLPDADPSLVCTMLMSSQCEPLDLLAKSSISSLKISLVDKSTVTVSSSV